MITLYTLSSRQLNNTTFAIGPVLLSQFVDVQTCGGILVRFEIESMNVGASIVLTYTIRNGAEYKGGASTTYRAVGKHEVGFGRGDFDDTTTIEATVQFIGRSRVNGVIYSVAKGEDVLEWL